MLTDVVIANKSYTKLNIPETDTPDFIALKVIKQDCPDFLMPIKTMEIDSELEIRYEMTDGIRLSYMPANMDKQDFITMIVNMLLPFKLCSDWFLDYHNFLLDENYILVGKNGKSIKYVYLPSAAYGNSDKQIKEFFLKILLNIDIKDNEGYMVNPLRILNSQDSNLIGLLEYFQQEAMSVASKQKSQNLKFFHTSPASAEEYNSEIISYGMKVSEQNSDIDNKGQDISQKPTAQQHKLLDGIKNTARFSGIKEKKQQASESNNITEQKSSDNQVIKWDSSRPGHVSEIFGKNDDEGKLMENLFGELNEPQKQKKDKKTGKEPQKSNGIGLFKRFKGKLKEDKEPKVVEESLEEKTGNLDREIHNNSAEISVKESISAYSCEPQINLTDYSENTIIEEIEEENDNSVLRLRLENAVGCSCPSFIEINLENGPVTVGRMNKNGEVQADFNFDASVSFVSRRHFRVEKDKNMEEWKIIDLKSSNGTFINGEKLYPNIPHSLCHDDIITISCNKRLLMYRVY